MNSTTPKYPLKVYLVEDSELIRLRLRQLLGSLERVRIVGEAGDAGAALAGIARSHADVAVVDLHLATGSGLALLKQLAIREPRVVSMVLTNHATAQFKRECLNAGARYFFDKTNEFDLVRQTIRRIVELSSNAPTP